MAADASCASLSSVRAVFVVALGRTGSSHLLRILNAIDGYRLSGETDNAWIHIGRLMADGHARREATLCDLRRLLMQLHNPAPSARVFGFKEIYSPFVRRGPDGLAEVLAHGVSSLRTLFPLAKVRVTPRWPNSSILTAPISFELRRALTRTMWRSPAVRLPLARKSDARRVVRLLARRAAQARPRRAGHRGLPYVRR